MLATALLRTGVELSFLCRKQHVPWWLWTCPWMWLNSSWLLDVSPMCPTISPKLILKSTLSLFLSTSLSHTPFFLPVSCRIMESHFSLTPGMSTHHHLWFCDWVWLNWSLACWNFTEGTPGTLLCGQRRRKEGRMGEREVGSRVLLPAAVIRSSQPLVCLSIGWSWVMGLGPSIPLPPVSRYRCPRRREVTLGKVTVLG